MEIGELYQFVLLLVMIGLILGVGILVLDKFTATLVADLPVNVTTSNSIEAINGTVNALSPIATSWLPLVVTIVVLVIIVGLVIRGFGSAAGERK